MRALVSIFAALLIGISLYQLSFTWFVNKHEAAMEEKADRYVKSLYPQSPEQKYPGNKDAQLVYQDSLDDVKNARLRLLLDSTKDQSITWWGHSYQKSKESELLLGLDLQGGINVTMDVELSGLIKGLANNPNDAGLKKALDEATRRKITSDADYITLFSQSFKEVNPGKNLAPLFANSTRNKLKIDASDNSVISHIRDQAKAAMTQTFEVLSKRIDKFGVAQPSINLDENKGIISVELAGAKDPERVRRFLQSTANLQFWSLYNIAELDQAISEADKALAISINGSAPVDTTKVDSTTIAKKDTTKSVKDLLGDTTANKGTASVDKARSEHPLLSVIQFIPPTDANKDGKYEYRSELGYVAIKDTGVVNGYLSSLAVKNVVPANAKFLYGKRERDDAGKLVDYLGLYAIKMIPGTEKARIEGEDITDAEQNFDPNTSDVLVMMSMNKRGSAEWAKMTTEATANGEHKPIAIVLDEIVYSAPMVNEPITGGQSRITMGRRNDQVTIQEAKDLSSILKSGKLNAPAKIVQEQVVGPTLGEAAVKGGANAFLISFAVIFVLMLVYYNSGGWVANIALILNLFFTVGVLSMFHATLTAPGIAGLVLTIGMAVDTNVIIFERIKEELEKGKTYMQAVKDGYWRSLPPVLDAHVTTLLTAFILLYFGLGPVKGFATTQILGILLSLFCGILLSRLITDFWTKKNRHFNYFTPISRRIFKHAAYKFIEYRKVAYAISIVVALAGIGGAIFNGFREGVEFSGGRSYVVKFDRPVDADAIRHDLAQVFGEEPVIKTYGGKDQLDITTDYLIKQEGPNVDSAVRNKLFAGLQKYLPSTTTSADFANKSIQATKTVKPTISDDLKTGAKWATFWSLLIIALYIFIRFRDWRYSVGTIFALLHDVLVTLAVFSFFKDVVPFPLEIDQHFIAAILTVIGFSMNDTVIVFDRVREYSRTMKGSTKTQILNKAINDTLARTIMTSLTVFLTILILFIVGGEVTKGFAFAMLIGVITGTYSSIFVAAPILIDFAKNKPLGEADTVHAPEKKIEVKPATTKA